ncbi:hypothetical protein SAMN04488522_102374 [Pedobacter caeni]|uniref:Uncharacterized protein n=1 Tax=Pedobacter caeni TaxID=288992 RepID=A0A1M4ZM24_9SPHI|nr:hypothetical protein SAMN04488522_102374 [Pedobacter caeni]
MIHKVHQLTTTIYALDYLKIKTGIYTRINNEIVTNINTGQIINQRYKKCLF